MKNLKLFESYSKFKIEGICKNYNIINYIINDDGSIDVNDNVCISPSFGFEEVEEIPIKFNRVSGYFTTKSNNLKTLKNSPNWVGGYFNCSFNRNLTTLIGGPNYVGGNYWCQDSNLRDVYGLATTINGDLELNANPVFEIIMLLYATPFRNYDFYKNEEEYSTFRERKRFAHALNENNVIRNGDTIIIDRLKESLYSIGVPDTGIDEIMERIDFTSGIKNYKFI